MKDKAYETALNPKHNGYQKRLASMVCKIFNKKTRSGARDKARVNVNEVLPQELHKEVIKKFKRWKVYARCKDNIWAADLVEMESLYSKNRGIKYLLCVIDVFTKYAWLNLWRIEKLKLFLMVLLE